MEWMHGVMITTVKKGCINLRMWSDRGLTCTVEDEGEETED